MSDGELETEPGEVDAHEARLMPRPHQDDSEMDITPMIDMTFLLLIFFLVASKMDRSNEVRLPPAEHGVAVDRGRLVREAVAEMLIDLESHGEDSVVVQRLRGT